MDALLDACLGIKDDFVDWLETGATKLLKVIPQKNTSKCLLGIEYAKLENL